MSRTTQSMLVGTILLGAALGCAGSKSNGSTAPEKASATIGSAGGQLVLAGAAQVDVPPGALTADTVLDAELASPPVGTPSAEVSSAVALTPHGIAFARAVHISLNYTGDPAGMAVLRLADDSANTWEPVGGVTYANGQATFESTTFSYYVVTSNYTCTPKPVASACTSTCTCCGTANCVNLKGDAANCGACGVTCAAGSFCANGTCAAVGPASLCANPSLYVIHGELPPLSVVSPEETTDERTAKLIASSVMSQCGNLTLTTVSEAQQGILDPCTSAPLLGGGNTLLVVGGHWSQRLARWGEGSAGPVVLVNETAGSQNSFVSRAGATLVKFNDSALTQHHDYFLVATYVDPARGAQIVNIYGVGWQGTPAALFYVTNTLLPAVKAGTVDWSHYVLVEWIDDGDGAIGAHDTFKVLAKDTP